MRGLLLFSFAVLMFLYGFISRDQRIFPFSYLNEANIASKALSEVTNMPVARMPEEYRVKIDKPTVIQHGELGSSEYILVSAGSDMRLPSHEEGVMAWVIDRDGRVVHVWRDHADLWNDLKTVKRIPAVSGPISPAGLHLFPDGSLLAAYHGQNTFPYAVGMAKFDRDSKLLWKKELLTHHFFSLDKRGHIFVPAMSLVESPVKIGDTSAKIETYKGTIYRDQIVELDSDGNEVDRIDVLQLLVDSGRHGLLTQMNTNRLENEDPTHLNDVRVIDEQQSAALPGVEPGDLLISLRNLNTIAILSPKSKRIVWCNSGTTVGQHSPRLFERGVMALDNLGGDERHGGTRLVQIDYASGQPSTVFPKPNVELPDFCRTAYSGHVDIQGDHQHALVTISNAGAVWEVDLPTGKVVWEYLVNHPHDPTYRACVGFAGYVKDPHFLTSGDDVE